MAGGVRMGETLIRVFAVQEEAQSAMDPDLIGMEYLLLLLLIAPVLGNLGRSDTSTNGPTTDNPPDGPDVCELCPKLPGGGCVPKDHPLCRPPPPPGVILAAQIVLGAALVIAGGALVSVIMRMCSRHRESRRGRGDSRTSIRTLDAFVAQRLNDSPPKYDEISWDKPPSYCSAPGTPLPQVRSVEVVQGFGEPPAYDNPVFTVESSAAQLHDADGRQSGQSSRVACDSTSGPSSVFPSPGASTS